MARTCTQCEKEMMSGYIIADGEEYYCSDKCLLKVMTKAEYLALYDEGEGDSYWTTWIEEEPIVPAQLFTLAHLQ